MRFSAPKIALFFFVYIYLQTVVRADTILGVDSAASSDSELYLIDENLPNPITTFESTVSPSTSSVSGLSYDSATKTLYGVGLNDSSSNGRLYTVDRATGAILTDRNVGNNLDLQGVAFDPSSGSLFAIDFGAGRGLVEINVATGQGTARNVPGPELYQSLVFNSTGILYSFDNNANELVTLNLQTGNSEDTWSTNLSSIQGLTFFNGLLYAASGDGNLYTLDPDDFAGNTNLTGINVGELGSVDFQGLATVPEPSTTALMILAGMFMIGHRFLRRNQSPNVQA